MNEPSRNFKGIWIPAEVWLDRRLTYFEKFLFAEIHSLDGEEKGCYASNQYLMDFFQERERKIQQGIGKLKELGYVYQDSFDGRTRTLRTKVPENDKSKFSTSEVLNSAPLTCRKSTPPHIYNNKENNKEQQQQRARAAEAPKAYDCDSAAAVFSDSQKKKHEGLVGPEKNAWFSVLDKVDIPQDDKIEITRSYEESVVKNAIEWATSPQNPPTKCLAASIKYAAKRGLSVKDLVKAKKEDKIPKPKRDVSDEQIEANRAETQEYIKENWGNINIRRAVSDKVGFVQVGNDNLYYKDVKFKELFKHYIRKIQR